MRPNGLAVQGGHLWMGGCDTVNLAAEYGTPLYVMDEDQIRESCRQYIASMAQAYRGNGMVVYASKALSCKEIYRIVLHEGLEVEVVSGGELYTARAAGVPGEKIHFQGNNKTPEELTMAVKEGVGDIVVDNREELYRLQEISCAQAVVSRISIRVKPGIDPHTHEAVRTGQIDSKFGVSIETGEALALVAEARSMTNLSLQGLHCHIGSQIFETAPFVAAAEVMLRFYAEIRDRLGLIFPRLNLGGGFGVAYTQEDPAVPYGDYVTAAAEKVHALCEALELPCPQIVIEPGRSIVAEAGITLYTVGSLKEIPGVRNYAAVDGGMFENPRYALYQAEHDCMLANRAEEPADYLVTVAGKCCESGDLIGQHRKMPKPRPGDLMAVLGTGAYHYSMSSNYNRNLRPPLVMVSKGKSRLAVKGETYEDLIRNDI